MDYYNAWIINGVKTMTPAQFYKTYFHVDRDKIKRVCTDARTNFANFQQIALAKGSCGKSLAKRLARASNNEMTIMEILYPEDYE